MFRPFSGGVELGRTYPEGFHLVAPWNSLIVYDVRLQEKEEAMDVLARNGLSIHMDVSIRFAPIPEEVPLLHKKIGPDYMTKIVLP